MATTDPSTGPLHPTEPASRFEPRPVETMRDDWLATLARIPGDGLKGAGFPRHVLGMLMHSPDTFGPFLEYWVTCKEKMALSVREQELVILRMGCLYRSNYVWKHHVPMGREFGVSEAELDAVRTGRYDGFPERERSILALTDELVEQRTIRAERWAADRGPLREVDVVDLIALVAQYVLFSLMNNALQVQIEASLGDVPAIDGPIG
jgi:alkylhydroperoxidase family enzyme